MAKQIISALHLKHRGEPILVIGGGPNAPRDVEKIPGWQDMVTISANAHGFKLAGARPQYIFCKDHYVKVPLRMRTKQKTWMEPLMRQYGVPIISRQHWADFRLSEWRVHGGNSGFYAIAVALCMGAWPAIAVGIDGFQDGTYFHDPKVDNVSLGHPLDYWKRRLTSFRNPIRTSRVRAVSGPVAAVFGTYRANEVHPPYIEPEAFAHYAKMPTYLARTLRNFQDPGDRETTIPKDYVVAMSSQEFERYQRLGLVKPEGPAPAHGEGAALRRMRETGFFAR